MIGYAPFLGQVRLVPRAGFRLAQALKCWHTDDGGAVCSNLMYYSPKCPTTPPFTESEVLPAPPEAPGASWGHPVAVSPSAIPSEIPGARMVDRGAEALRLSGMLTQVIQNNPGCFEGEDLSVAYALADKMKSQYFGSKEVPAPERGSIRLSEEEARVLAAAEACAKGQSPVSRATPPSSGANVPSTFPTTTVLAVGGLAVAGLIAFLALR